MFSHRTCSSGVVSLHFCGFLPSFLSDSCFGEQSAELTVPVSQGEVGLLPGVWMELGTEQAAEPCVLLPDARKNGEL